MLNQWRHTPILVRSLLTGLLAGAAVLVLLTIAKHPLEATLPTRVALTVERAKDYQDLLHRRDQARQALPRKISTELYYSPGSNKNEVTYRYLLPGKGEVLVTAAEQASFFKPYQDALDSAEKAVADFLAASEDAHSAN